MLNVFNTNHALFQFSISHQVVRFGINFINSTRKKPRFEFNQFEYLCRSYSIDLTHHPINSTESFTKVSIDRCESIFSSNRQSIHHVQNRVHHFGQDNNMLSRIRNYLIPKRVWRRPQLSCSLLFFFFFKLCRGIGQLSEEKCVVNNKSLTNAFGSVAQF